MYYHFNNEGGTALAYIANFGGMLCCGYCNKLFPNLDRYNGHLPEICPICKSKLDYSLIEDLQYRNPIVIDMTEQED